MDTRCRMVKICGRTVTVRPYRLFELDRVFQVQKEIDQGDNRNLYVLFALALWMDPEDFKREFPNIDMFEAEEITAAIKELESDFLTRKMKKTAKGAGSVSA